MELNALLKKELFNKILEDLPGIVDAAEELDDVKRSLARLILFFEDQYKPPLGPEKGNNQ
ncbi:MAG: hypothetical protein A3E78_09170 [Alphaproteobacteria bacterium RIFCSPHIGHO2_12_FULL_63_12]|nr:MAG: hypothetical protein A3E78_09170 [Alphaproteobacteria bacterium RIFCSPHIGHO2_12_FULL_63_12]